MKTIRIFLLAFFFCIASLASFAEEIGNLPVPVTAYSPSPVSALSNINRDDRVQLLWMTPPEIVPVVYAVERSLDGEHFESLGEVQSRCHVNQAATYIFNDMRPHSGQSFYRIRQTDVSGKVTLSKVLPVQYEPRIKMSEIPVVRPS